MNTMMTARVLVLIVLLASQLVVQQDRENESSLVLYLVENIY